MLKLKEIKNEIWILADKRPGTFMQSIGLAEELKENYRIINLEYSIFSALPNFILNDSLVGINRKTRNQISAITYLPSIIISAGRRSASVALNLKKQSQNKSKIIQIMNPNLDFTKFDLVILPEHDNVGKKLPNVIITIGSLNRSSTEKIISEKEKFTKDFGKIQKNKIALLLGGSSNKTEFTEESAIKLAKKASEIAVNMNAVLLVLNSRRTSDKITESVKANLKCDFQFFDWKEVKDNNPYLAILGYADFFIITGDSVSMVSECCSQGKPVYIFDENNISSPKHRRFHQNLFQNGYARDFSSVSDVLTNFPAKKLLETARVAQIVKNQLG